MSDNTKKQEIKKFLDTTSYIRVIRMAKTPTIDDFKSTSALVLGAITVVGLFGYLVFQLMSLIPM